MLTKIEVMFCGRARRSAHVMTLGAPKSGAAGACVLWATDVGPPQQKYACLIDRPNKFIEWSPPCKAQSRDPPSRQQRPDRRTASDSTEVSHEGTQTGTASTNWFPTATAGSSDPSSGQRGVFCPDEPGLAAQPSPNNYPDPDWDSPSVTAVDEEEEIPDSQRLGAGVNYKIATLTVLGE
jgi:hypothetical protein